MSQDSLPAETPPPRGPAPLTASARHRLQKVYEHGQRCLEKQDYDYAHQLFSQCVVEDPANITYLQAMLDNLQRKYGNNKKGAKLAALKIKAHRNALHKAAGRGEWEAAFQSGCAALALNPWDTATLIGMAEACRELEIDECQLFYLKWSLNFDATDPIVNRLAALQLTRMGQFDQAIACWHRVEQAKPHDEEAQQAISHLSVEKTIHQGGYDPTLLNDPTAQSGQVARLAHGGAEQEDGEPDVPVAERLQQAIAAEPAEIDNYLQLADIYVHEGRLDEAEGLLGQAHQASGGGHLLVRERLEDLQIRRAARQVASAQRQFEQDPSEEAKAAWQNFRRQANQVELEVYAARSDRDPQNPRLKFELGSRLKKAGKHKEAITALQAARSDPKRKALVLLELGECFQKIEQYKLAQSHYEQAIDACTDADEQVRMLALYRAGVLATGLRELDLAERWLTELAGLDYGYRDVAERLDKINELRNSG